MIRDLVIESIRNLRAHWLRVLLTGSGIAWGVALFSSLSASGAAARAHYQAKMEAIGRKVIYVFPGTIPERGGGPARRVELDRDDPPRLPASPLIDRAAPEVWLGLRVLKGGGHIKVVWTYGVGAESGRIRNFAVGAGRFLSPADVANRRRVAVLGARVAERLFGRRSAIGRAVRLEGEPFEVIGVSEPKGEQMVNMGPRDDEQVLIPVSTAQSLFTGSDRIDYAIYEPRTRPEGVASIARVRALLAPHHHFSAAVEEALGFFNIADAIAAIDGLNLALEIFLVSCGFLTLAAGGIGVMNIMLVAVAERTRELAVRKAVGATDRDLFFQLLCETVAMTLLAGSAGVALGAVIVRLMGIIRGANPRAQFLTPEVHFSLSTTALAFAVLVAVGIVAGIVPARRAARLDPAVALREE